MTDIVVVESPAKAKTIEKYLGSGYRVLASFGHVRDLVEKDGAVLPQQDFAMLWQSDERGQKQVAQIAGALKGAKRLILATDPDREGEAISWHVKDMLAEKRALAGVEVQRVTFNEITKRAVQQAMAAPRDIDAALVDAYLARRALDYLVGFTLSPVLWRKLPGSRGAGRVQSVALRLVAEREAEIEAFRAREYWTIEARFTTPAGAPFTARLTHLAGRRLEQFDLPDEAAALSAKAAVEAGRFSVASVEKKRVRRHPPPPFQTSTLQQEASRKLGFGVQQTMRIAQQLYEGVELGGETVGLITYMRTDGVDMAREAVAAIRAHVGEAFGAEYLPGAPREYKSRAKNAQEAHEAIRPTDVVRRPEDVARHLSVDQRRLYELVWKRAVASQMESAQLDQTTVEIAEAGDAARLRATGSVIAFDGFLKLYREDRDDAAAEDDEGRILPPMAERDALRRGEVLAEQHFTQPPPRYTEASLVKKLEELGIGRPSTYASILGRIQDQGYVRLENRRFHAEDLGRLLTAFLVAYFEHWFDPHFTAGMEETLDDISGGRAEWRAVMRAFWQEFHAAVEATRELRIRDVIDRLDEALGPHFFPANGAGSDPRACPSCGSGRLGLRLANRGAFIGCSNYPECRYTRPLALPNGQGDAADAFRLLGQDPDGQPITLRRGPYGLYVQRGEATTDARGKPVKPRRASLPRGMDPDSLTLERALALLSMPRTIGPHPETGQEITANLGRFGPYLTMGDLSKTLDRDDDVLSIGLNRAVILLADAKPRGVTLGVHPKDGVKVEVRKGRFGPYLLHGSTVANLPRGTEMTAVSLEQAVALLAERGKPLAAKGGKRRAATSRASAPATPKRAATKPAATKPAATKAAATKAAAAKPRAAAKAPAKATAKPKPKPKAKPARRPAKSKG
jgi:DNA topoisomerase-1